MSWLTRFFRRDRLERELDAELTFHVEAHVRDLIASGVDPAEARRRVLATFGVEPIKEAARDARGTRWLHDFAHDLRYAGRLMRKHPGFTIAAVLSLAIGLGANVAMFSVVDALILRPLDVKAPNELYLFNRTSFKDPNPRVSYPLFDRFRKEVPSLRFAVMTPVERMQVTLDGRAHLVIGQLVSGEWFDLLGVGASHGRVLEPADDADPAGRQVVVISDGYWARRFGRDPTIVGQTISVNGAALTVVGITRAGFAGTNVGQRVDVWVPTALQVDVRHRSNASTDDADDTKPWRSQDGIQWLTMIARVPASISVAQATSQIDVINAQNLQQRAAPIQNPDRRARIMREHAELLSNARGQSGLRTGFSQAVLVLMTTVAIVLIIACANLANLLMARNAARGQEFAVRLSLGARRGRLVRQLLTESLTLAILGGALGVLVARWAGAGLLRLASSTSSPVPLDLTFDGRLIAFSAAASLLTGAFFGLMPALRISRVDPYDAIRTGGRVIGVTPRRGRISASKVLVVAQVALSFVLLAVSVLFLRTFENLVTIDSGYEKDHVIAAPFDARLAAVDEQQLPALYDRLLSAARAIPGATSATLSMSGLTTGSWRISSVMFEGREPSPEDTMREDFVTPGYFTTIGMPLVRGRDFDTRDSAGKPRVAIVNQGFAKKYFPGVDPIGKRFGYGPADTEVIGIAGDARIDGLRSTTPEIAYYPAAQAPREYLNNLYVRVAGPVEPAARDLTAAVAAAAPNLAVRDVATLGEMAERTVTNERLVARLTGVFSLLAVAVACLGLYGTISYAVTRRRNEMGVRLALGASPGRIRWLVLRETLVLVAAGGVAGLVVFLTTVRFVATFLYGLSPRDPLTIGGSAALVVAVGLFAGAIPAWRASRVAPTTALRTE